MTNTLNSIALRQRVVMYAVLALSVAFGVAAEERTLTVTFEERSLTVSGARPGHQVIAFGLGIGRHGRLRLLTRHVEVLNDQDGDGIVTFKVHSLPKRSVWVAVDFETGDYSVVTPTGDRPTELILPADSWRGNRAHLDVPRVYLEVLVVRRGVGAWNVRMADGGSRDGDHVGNGISRLRLDEMDRLIGDQGPPFALPNDLLVAIDPRTLDCFASEAR